MRKTGLVLINEFITTVTRRSFLLTAFGLPLVTGLIVIGLARLSGNQGTTGRVGEIFSTESQQSPLPEGYVDEGGLIRALPESIPPGALRAFPDPAAAEQALTAGEISAYYRIPADYAETGELIYVRPDFNPLSAFDQSNLMEWAIKVNLVGGDEQLAARANNPFNLEVVSLAPTDGRDQDSPLAFFVPYGATLIFYIVILMSSSFLLNSLTKEKENRVIEVLMSSVTPRQLLAGKILGLGLVGLLQMVAWAGSGLLLLRLTGRSFDLPAGFQLPLSFLVWGLIFFLLGYGVYASLMASVGALVPNLREASQATFVIILPLLIPLMLISVLIEDPNGSIATGLSLFPLTSPVVMMTRLAATEVPLWQVLLSIGILVVTVTVVMRTVAGMFRAQTLLSGQEFNLKRLFSSLVRSD